jgi:hypothetical protein
MEQPEIDMQAFISGRRNMASGIIPSVNQRVIGWECQHVWAIAPEKDAVGAPGKEMG